MGGTLPGFRVTYCLAGGVEYSTSMTHAPDGELYLDAVHVASFHADVLHAGSMLVVRDASDHTRTAVLNPAHISAVLVRSDSEAEEPSPDERARRWWQPRPVTLLSVSDPGDADPSPLWARLAQDDHPKTPPPTPGGATQHREGGPR